MAGLFPVNKDSENFDKLSRLLVVGGTQALRGVLDGFLPPSSLSTQLNHHYKTLHSLWCPPRGKRKILNNDQWDKLFPKHGLPPPTSKDFDITLIFVLLRNICLLKPPSSGWDSLPASTDNSIPAHIARIKFYRNKLCHVNNAAFDDVEFENYWKEISTALIALGISSDEVNDLKSRPSGATDYKALLQKWNEDELDLFRETQEVRKEVQGVSHEVQDLKQAMNSQIQGVGADVQSVQQIVEGVGQSVNEKFHGIAHEVQTICQEIQEIKDGKIGQGVAESDELAKRDKAMDKWLEYLLSEYTTGEASYITPLPWLEFESKFNVQKMFKEPKIVTEDESRLNMCDLFEPLNKKRVSKVLLEGNPGVGKTSFCKNLVHLWALRVQGNKSNMPLSCIIPEEIKVVLLLHCRDIANASDWRDFLRQAIPENYSDEDKERIVRYICDNEKSVALVIDGYDELPASSRKSLNTILSKKALPQSCMVVTSRKNHLSELKNSFDRKLEITGWNFDDAKELFTSYFSSSPTVAHNLLRHVTINQKLRDLVCNPLYASMLCLVFEDNAEYLTSQRHQDITTLNKEILFCITKRHIKRKGLEVEDCDLEERFKDWHLALGKYAYEALKENKLCFTAMELPKDLLDLGVVVKNKAPKKIRCEVTYSFLHKSLQDYLAALFFADCFAKGEGEEFFSFSMFHTLCNFDLASMIGTAKASTAVKSLANILNPDGMMRYYSRSVSMCTLLDYDYVIKLMCECLHEVKCGDQGLDGFIQLLPQNVSLKLYLFSSKAVSGLCYWLSYGTKSKCGRDSIEGLKILTISDISPESEDMLHTIINSCRLNNSICELLEITDISVQLMITVVRAMKKDLSIKRLILSSSDTAVDASVASAAAVAIAEMIIQNKVLEIVDLSNVPTLGDNTCCVLDAIEQNKSLKRLGLHVEANSSEIITKLARIVGQSEAIIKLRLGIGDSDDNTEIASALASNKSIKTLEVEHLACRERYSQYFNFSWIPELLTKNTVIEHMVLGFPIGEEGISSIIDTQMQNPSIKSLDFVDDLSVKVRRRIEAFRLSGSHVLRRVILRSHNGLTTFFL
ncbi:protein NLRC3 [Nematostella vectensis]|uniref:protein NLRC3 n=1 Tax=Nematostella vectensis TaxID=45351 RepID=UPI00207756DA|nr:protein NLRC3 [Nematostella vectensis]